MLGTPRAGALTLEKVGIPDSEHVVTRYELIDAVDGTVQMAVLLDYLGMRLATLSMPFPTASNPDLDALKQMAIVIPFEASDYSAADRKDATHA